MDLNSVLRYHHIQDTARYQFIIKYTNYESWKSNIANGTESTVTLKSINIEERATIAKPHASVSTLHGAYYILGISRTDPQIT